MTELAAMPAPSPAHEVISFVQMIERLARDKSVDIERLDRLLAMRERENARMAEQAWKAAMSAAQAEMEPVRADATNEQTRSRYASHAALDGAIRPIYTGHGLALTFDSGDAPLPDHVRIICDVSHSPDGHSRRYHLDMPVDGKGARGGDVMTKTHAMGSGITYGKRYLLGMIFNLAVTKDDDGNAAGGKLPAKIQRNVDRLKPGGSISERAMQARVAEAWRRPPPEPFEASQAGKGRLRSHTGRSSKYDERNPPPHEGIPDHAAKALNRQLHPMNDELPEHSAPPTISRREQMKASTEPLDRTERDGIPGFCDRREPQEDASYLDLVK
jgi:hypothetical protein